MKISPLILFLLITFLDAYFVGLGQKQLQFIIEPFITPVLFLYYWVNSSKKSSRLLLVFLFLWVGDFLLLFETSAFHLKWAVFFYFIVQVFLILHFFKYYKGYSLREHLLGILFYSSYLVIFLNHVYISLDDMRVHGVVYGFTLSFLGSFTIMWLLKQYSKPIALMTVGLFIFSVRDVLITYNKRYFEEEFFTFPIPLLHAIGFLLIVQSFLWLEQKRFLPSDQNPK